MQTTPRYGTEPWPYPSQRDAVSDADAVSGFEAELEAARERQRAALTPADLADVLCGDAFLQVVLAGNANAVGRYVLAHVNAYVERCARRAVDPDAVVPVAEAVESDWSAFRDAEALVDQPWRMPR